MIAMALYRLWPLIVVPSIFYLGLYLGKTEELTSNTRLCLDKNLALNGINKSDRSYEKNVEEWPREQNGTNWTILLTVNDGFFDFFQNWLHFYRKHNISYRMIILAEDNAVYNKLKQLDLRFTTIVNSGSNVSEAVKLNTERYKKIMSGRTQRILQYIEEGVDILLTDIDMVWIKNPMPFFTGDFDIFISRGVGNNLNAGFIAIKSNEVTIRHFRKVVSVMKENPALNDQSAFNKVYRQTKVHLNVLERDLFPSGDLYFQIFTWKQRSKVVVAHTATIIGHERKKEALQRLLLWFS